MSWNTINEILGLAVTNEGFAQELIANPLEAVRRRGYQLTIAEQEAFRLSSSQTLDRFTRNLLTHLPQKAQPYGREQDARKKES